ncbi:hypothetical protein OG21DRAFT_1479878 [Imleria badia]|nr:hypothetical protein OG21DRAFT_1479878 [Imleria badia]
MTSPGRHCWTRSLKHQLSESISITTLAAADDVVARVSALVLPQPVFRPFPLPPHLHRRSVFLAPGEHRKSYPSSEFKASLAQRYNSPICSAVSSWFANARRRMGWTALCRDFFRNCRTDAVDVAYRVLVKEDPNHQPGPEITHAFVTMKVTAEGLYAASAKSALAGDLHTVVRDMPAEDNILARDGRRGETEKMPSSSLVSCLDDSLTDESEEDRSPPSLAARKRHLSSELDQVASSRTTTRSVKRPRFCSSSLDPRLPSPSTRTQEPLDNDSSDQPSRVPGTQNSGNINFHKRRLSDPHATGIPKRPRATIAEPRLHSVSDPLPLSTLESRHSIDEWFKINFDVLFAFPPPVDVTEPDHSTQWEVELFNNYSIPEDLQKALTPPIQDNQSSSSTDLTALEDLLRSLDSGGFVAPPEIMHPPTMVYLKASCHYPIFHSSSIGSLNGYPSEPASDSLFPQSYVDSVLPEIDLSMLQLPQLWTTVAS